jgi:predicted CxxxxCH...CXXCH cytochrome family protein
MKKYAELVLIFAVSFVFGSCSKLQNNALAPVQSQSDIHPSGWATQSSSNFHGIYVKTHHYDMTTCTSCHGNDLKGGTAQVACYKCHEGSNGSLACITCHGSSVNAAPPKDLAGNSTVTFPTVGAHQNHLAGKEIFADVVCSSCHVVPQAAGPGLHPSGNGVAVMFSGIALTQSNVPGSQDYDDSLATVVPSPVFNFKTLQCSNTYCHGNFKGGNHFTPKWTVLDGSQDSCGSCHGTPPQVASHPQTVFGQAIFYDGPTSQNCYLCHEPMIDKDGIQDSSLHVNGRLELQGRSLSSW